MIDSKKKDFYFALSTGFIAGLIAWGITIHLGEVSNIYILLSIVLPLLWVTLIKISDKLSSKIAYSGQFSKFIITGFTNAILDYGVLNLLISQTGIENGKTFSIFKGIAFIIANISSYLLNKYWTFDKSIFIEWRKQYPSFLSISFISLLVNVGTASLIFGLNPLWNLPHTIWANISAVVGSACALIPNFIGYKYIVFKDKRGIDNKDKIS